MISGIFDEETYKEKIDEITKDPGVGLYVKITMDSGRQYGGYFLGRNDDTIFLLIYDSNTNHQNILHIPTEKIESTLYEYELDDDWIEFPERTYTKYGCEKL